MGRKGSRSRLFSLRDGSRSGELTGGWVVQDPLGSFAPIITFTAAGAGLRGRTRVGKTSSMMYTRQACWTQVGVEWGQ